MSRSNHIMKPVQRATGRGMQVLLGLLLFISSSYGQASQNDMLTQSILQRILQLQVKKESEFLPGMFPCYRSYQYTPCLLKKDDNIFFTGLVVFTLRTIYKDLPEHARRVCDSIFTRAEKTYPHFRNRAGRPTYNFWRTDRPGGMPNGGLFTLLTKNNSLPDDFDDTSILLLAMNADRDTAGQAHSIMQDFTNKRWKKVKSTFRRYRNIPAYSTWFGKKMPVDFDIGVLCNVLYFVNRYRLPYTGADSASLKLLVKMVKNQEYLSSPVYISPYYNRTPVILYHISRLMSSGPIPELEKYKTELVTAAKKCFTQSRDFMDRIILSTALYRWGTQPDDKDIIKTNRSIWSLAEESSFIFFVGNNASMLPNPFNRLLVKSGIAKFRYYSPAYNDALVLENMVLKETRKSR